MRAAAATARSEGIGREPTMGGVAVLIASDLSKDMAGEPLLRGVSLKLERRDRVTIAGRNGAGKTTLLRMLAGETSIDGGELVLAKNTRMALHDQRPPRERDLSLRDYVLSACKEPLELEAELARLEHAMADGDEQALNRYSDVHRALRGRRRLRLARARALRPSTAWASSTTTSTARWRRSPAASSRARRWRGRSPPSPTCCCSTSPPTTSTSSRWSGWRRRC